MTFQKLGLHSDLLRGVQELGFRQPTPIQERSIPPALAGKDVLACAMTGSGKSAAFLLPILERLLNRKRGATRALILTPTRELAAQITEHMQELAVHTQVRGASIFGGVGMGPQEHALRNGTDVIVATPGRLLDHMRHPYVDFRSLEVLVLDEADRMLDMGFLPDIKKIVGRLPTKRQTLFFSATMPPPIAKLADAMLVKPERIDIERRSAPAVGITQAIYPVSQGRKNALLLQLLRGEGVDSALVFTRTKHRANRLAKHLDENGVQTDRIHGNRSQSQRTQALDMFKRGKFRVLVATDIAARGIDVTALSHVINYDVPGSPEDYIHRVGRTARAEQTGDAFTLVSPDEESDLRDIEKTLGKRLPRITLPDFDYDGPADNLKGRGPMVRGGRTGSPSRAPLKRAAPARGGFGSNSSRGPARAPSAQGSSAQRGASDRRPSERAPSDRRSFAPRTGRSAGPAPTHSRPPQSRPGPAHRPSGAAPTRAPARPTSGGSARHLPRPDARNDRVSSFGEGVNQRRND
ncbi:MAG: DEAD/DEAH box helicase [Planctomycetota bacterium]|nr:DEAD/DEAH box helicase [Planctomycetota bacterium]